MISLISIFCFSRCHLGGLASQAEMREETYILSLVEKAQSLSPTNFAFQMNGWMDGWMHGWMDGRMDDQTRKVSRMEEGLETSFQLLVGLLGEAIAAAV
jgi:hypothetical protein